MGRLKSQSVRFMLLTFAGLALAMLMSVEPSQAQQKLDAQLDRAATEYKSSLEQLLTLYERDSKRAEERLTTARELLAQGLVTRREVETAEDAAARTREKVAEAQAQLKGADMAVAEASIEAEAEKPTRKLRSSLAPHAENTPVRTTAYIRYGGAGAWSLADADGIKQFFIRRFGRALPIGAFGQSALHDRWGYDHRNAMDIGVNPDSNEGQALIEYLRANGIPFTAFHFAVPGKATGPHIHVGLPSHRIAPRWLAANSHNMSGQ
jgi:outer membrane efflux protein